jgi:hypothetical protein
MAWSMERASPRSSVVIVMACIMPVSPRFRTAVVFPSDP